MKNKLWRTLVRIESFNAENIYFVLPGWNSDIKLSLSRNELPKDINNNLDSVDLPYRLHVKCNIGNENSAELIYSDCEMSS